MSTCKSGFWLKKVKNQELKTGSVHGELPVSDARMCEFSSFEGTHGFRKTWSLVIYTHIKEDVKEIWEWCIIVI